MAYQVLLSNKCNCQLTSLNPKTKLYRQVSVFIEMVVNDIFSIKQVQAQLLQFAAKNIGLSPALLTSPINPQHMTMLNQLYQLQLVSGVDPGERRSSCLR
jgi:hypothetical protein